jgi:hypothetical protein
LIIVLNTPGGLDTSMREIVSRIDSSRVPVVVYVAPSGARAASAGFVILMAADLAAMAPGTNTGAAHPVLSDGSDLQKTMGEKVTNDAAAYVRSHAERRGRNPQAAELTIRESRAFTEREAREGTPVVIVDENLARRFWPGQDALGKRIKYDSPTPHEIVGVVGNVRNFGSEAEGRIRIYTPLGRAGLARGATLSVRTNGGGAEALAASVVREIQAVDKDLPAPETETLEQIFRRAAGPRRFNAALLGLLGYCAGLPEANVYRGNLPYFLCIAALGTLLYHTLVFVLLQALGLAMPPILQTFAAAVPAALLNALLIAPTFVLCRRLLRTMGGWTQLRL